MSLTISIPDDFADVLGASAEERDRGAPEAVRVWTTELPAWVEVREATLPVEAKDISPADREAIALAKELGAAVLLMDDRQRGSAQRPWEW